MDGTYECAPAWRGEDLLADSDPSAGYHADEAGPKRRYELAGRYLEFAAAVIGVVARLPRSMVGRHVGDQLLRCGTSPGANYEEACGAESRTDFIHKMGVVLKELKESRYWLHISLRAEPVAPSLVQPVLAECEELCAITAKSILTAKSRA